MKRITLIVAVSIGFLKGMYAQYDPMFTQYMFNEMFINPAYAGAKEALSLTALHRQQWVDFPGRPITTTFSANAPIMNNTMGVGLSILNEKIGVTNRNLAYLSYAYRIKVSEKGKLSFGLMAGIHNQLEKYSELKTTSGQDMQFASNTPSVIMPNFGTGVYYYTDKFYAGLSIPRMIDNQIRFSAAGGKTENSFNPSTFHYYFVLGRLFNVAENLKLKPQIMTKATQNAPIECDINLNALLKETLWLGVSYRTRADISGIIGLQLNPQFLVSYSYDYPLTAIKNYSQGSHEIMLNYLFGFKGKKIVTPRYF